MAHANTKRVKTNNKVYGNRFSALDDSNADCMEDTDDPSAEEEQLRVSIPPIKVLGIAAEDIHSICTTTSITDYCVKKISIGVKVHCDSEDSSIKLMKWLQLKKFDFFTHPKKGNKPFKAVMFGLEGEPESEVKSELLRRGFKCCDVKSITKERAYGSDTLYIAYFEHGTTNIQELKKKVSSIFHTIVRWDHQRRPRGLVVQCRNCQLFGHGESNCHVATKCALCGNDHKTSTCKESVNFICANCGLNHKAFDWQCPKRSLYEEIREKSRVRSRPTNTRNSYNTFVHQNNQFPPLSPKKISSFNAPASQHDKIISHNYADVLKTNSNVDGTSHLFSQGEIADLLMEMLPRLSKCRSKQDQFQVITNLAIKFLYNQP